MAEACIDRESRPECDDWALYCKDRSEESDGSDGNLASTQAIINVLPTATDTPTPTCAAFTTQDGSSRVPSGAALGSTVVPSDPIGPFVDGALLQKRMNPSKNQWGLAYAMGNLASQGVYQQAQNVTLTKWMMPLTPTQALFSFQNTTSGDKQYVAFNTSTCTPTRTFQLKTNERAFFRADAKTTKTILFRHTMDGKTWKNISIISTGPFWTLFGDKEVDFQWFDSYPRYWLPVLVLRLVEAAASSVNPSTIR